MGISSNIKSSLDEVLQVHNKKTPVQLFKTYQVANSDTFNSVKQADSFGAVFCVRGGN